MHENVKQVINDCRRLIAVNAKKFYRVENKNDWDLLLIELWINAISMITFQTFSNVCCIYFKVTKIA